jgi:hypothetical protein
VVIKRLEVNLEASDGVLEFEVIEDLGMQDPNGADRLALEQHLCAPLREVHPNIVSRSQTVVLSEFSPDLYHDQVKQTLDYLEARVRVHVERADLTLIASHCVRVVVKHTNVTDLEKSLRQLGG